MDELDANIGVLLHARVLNVYTFCCQTAIINQNWSNIFEINCGRQTSICST